MRRFGTIRKASEDEKEVFSFERNGVQLEAK
jgi:hypothetical protein